MVSKKVVLFNLKNEYQTFIISLRKEIISTFSVMNLTQLFLRSQLLVEKMNDCYFSFHLNQLFLVIFESRNNYL